MKNLSVVQAQIQRDTAADQVAVQNAEASLRSAETQVANAQRKAGADVDVAARQVERALHLDLHLQL